MLPIYAIIGIVNFIITIALIFYIVNFHKKKSYAVILNKEGESIDSIKINPSYEEIKHDYDGKSYTYIKPKGTSFIKHKNDRLYLYEFNKPEPLNKSTEYSSILYADVFNDLLEMSKIKALNKEENIFGGLFSKKNVFIILIIIVGIIVLFTQVL